MGKILEHAVRRSPIPLGWAIDRTGAPTTDPEAAMAGSLQPIGGYKGFGLALMVDVLGRVNQIAAKPEFYNTLTNNCTSNIVRIIDRGLPRSQRLGLSWRLLFSGYADAFAYDVGRLAGDGPFAELKRRSRIS